MMFTGKGKVWDSKKNISLCNFGLKGVLHTEDAYVIKRLRELGYVEANESNMVNVEICNGINVDWREKYDTVMETNRKLRSDMIILRQEYTAMETRLTNLAEVVEVPIAVKAPDKVVADWKAEFYEVGGNYVTRDYPNINGVSALNKLKTFIKSQTGVTDMRAMKKDETIRAVTKILKDKGLI